MCSGPSSESFGCPGAGTILTHQAGVTIRQKDHVMTPRSTKVNSRSQILHSAAQIEDYTHSRHAETCCQGGVQLSHPGVSADGSRQNCHIDPETFIKSLRAASKRSTGSTLLHRGCRDQDDFCHPKCESGPRHPRSDRLRQSLWGSDRQMLRRGERKKVALNRLNFGKSTMGARCCSHCKEPGSTRYCIFSYTTN